MNNEPSFNSDQAKALKQIRLRWGIALLLNLPLPFMALPIVGAAWLEQTPDGIAGKSMGYGVVTLLLAIGCGIVARNQSYKAGWKGDVVTPAAYLKGNTLFFLSLSAGAFGLFLISITGGWPAPTFTAAPIILGLLIFNFPNGQPMKPAPPRMLDGDTL